MKNFISLLKTLSNNSRIAVDHKGLRRKFYFGGIFLVSAAIVVPCMLIVELISNIMTEALASVGAPMNGLLVELHILSAFSVVFGIWVIFNLMFFSSDRETLLSLPFKPHEILAAKFTYSYLAESSIEFLLLGSVFVGFFRIYGCKTVSVISAILAIFLIPILPLIYCALIGLFLLTILKKVRSAKIFNSVSTILMLCFIGLFLLSFKNMATINIENYVANLSSGTDIFTNVLDKIFFPMPFLIEAIENNSLSSLLIYIGLNIFSVILLLVVGYFFYKPALHTIGRLGSGDAKANSSLKFKEPSNVIVSYLYKEWKILVRTRAYANNCVWVNLIWPIGILVFLLINKDKEILDQLLRWHALGYERMLVLMTILFVLVAFVLTSMNSIASSTFTREGTHIDFIKYMPVSYKDVVVAKFLMSMLVSFPTQYLGIIISGIFLRYSFLEYLLYGIMTLLIDMFISLLGLMLDSRQPFTTWSDEYSALRGNANTFFDMAVTMLIAVFVGGFPWLIYHLSLVSLTGFYLLLGLTISVMSVFSILLFYPATIKNLGKL